MADLNTLIVPLLIVVILVATALGVMLYAIRRLKARRAQLLSQLQESPDLVEDRAYNRLRMAKSEVDILERQGTDVTRARALLHSAQEAFDQHNYPSALSRAQSAHETLVALRQGTGAGGARVPDQRAIRLRSDDSGPRSGASALRPAVDLTQYSPPTGGLDDPDSGSGMPSAPPRNRAESRFQLSVLTDEIAQARQTRPKDPTIAESDAIRAQASAAYDRAEYTESLRLALKARRRIGGRLETLPPPSTTGRGGPDAAGIGPSSAMDVAERTAESTRCPQCGAPMTSADKFCRGCGAPRSDRSCPRCRQVAQPGDTFCGNCGSALP
ncbi:MAG: zinc ribbon domain-containing protein [Thermoplasmata archaeon]